MKTWKTVQRELNALRLKHGRDRSLVRQFPDLTVELRTSPTSDRIDNIVYGPASIATEDHGLIVDTLHKQGPMVLLKEELPWAGGKKP